MPNTNCLSGMKCPDCDNEDLFNIQAKCSVNVSDDGTDDASSFEWDSSSPCSCPACDKSGIVRDFLEKPESPDQSSLWYNDEIQFPRLISEIQATCEFSLKSLMDSMDLSREQLNELFDRAQKKWERIKQSNT